MDENQRKKYQEYEKLGIHAAEQGDWDTAIKYGRYVPSNWNYWERLPSLSRRYELGHEVKIPDEALNKVLDIVSQKKDVLPNFLFELSNNLSTDMKPETFKRIAKLGKEDNYSLANLKDFLYKKRKTDPEWNKVDIAEPGEKMSTNFWNAYEKHVRPHAFATIKSLFTGKPEEITDHRNNTGKSHTGHYFINAPGYTNGTVLETEDHPSFQKRIDEYQVNGASSKHFTGADVIPHLPAHAKKVQDAVLNDESIPKKYFNGKPYIQLHRGVGGSYAKAIRDKVGHNPNTNEVNDTKYTLPTAHLTSWTTDKAMAERFASSRGEHEGVNGQGVVISAWHPVDTILHSGFHTVTPGQEHAHPDESEIIVGHPNGKFKISGSNLHFQKPNEFYTNIPKGGSVNVLEEDPDHGKYKELAQLGKLTMKPGKNKYEGDTFSNEEFPKAKVKKPVTRGSALESYYANRTFATPEDAHNTIKKMVQKDNELGAFAPKDYEKDYAPHYKVVPHKNAFKIKAANPKMKKSTLFQLHKSLEVMSDVLEKAAPRYEGEIDHKTDNIAVKHPFQPNVFTWQHSPQKAKNFQTKIDQNLDTFVNKFGEHGQSLKAGLNRILANKKHADLVLTDLKRQGIHTPRRRHVASLVSGDNSANIKHLGNGEFIWRQARHGENDVSHPYSWWKVNAQGFQDVTNQYKNSPKDFFQKSEEGYTTSGGTNEQLGKNGTRVVSDAGKAVLGRGNEAGRPSVGIHDRQRNPDSGTGLSAGGYRRLTGRPGSGSQNPGSGQELNKGMNGDWQKEGYSLHHEYVGSKQPGFGTHIVRAFDKNKNEVGKFSFDMHPARPDELLIDHSWVDAPHRRKGLANAGYALAQEKSGRTILGNEDQQSEDAKALWNNPIRLFGKSLEKSWHVKVKGLPDYHKVVDMQDLGPDKGNHYVLADGRKIHQDHIEDVDMTGEKLNKGMNGDWQKEGYSLKHRIAPGNESVIDAIDPSGHSVGYYVIGNPENSNNLYVSSAETHPDHQRKGLATAAYQLAEKYHNKTIKPEHLQTTDAKALWNQPNRPFGKSEQLAKRSKNVREQTRNITPEQAEARRVNYARKLGLRPERLDRLKSMFPTVNPLDHAAIQYKTEQFPVEHETAHAMMTPQGTNIAEYTHGLSYADPDAPAAERIKFDKDTKTAENVANQLEHRIDRRSGVGIGGINGKHLKHVSNQRTFVNAPTWNDETRENWLREHKMDRQWHDNHKETSKALNQGFGQQARDYANRFDEGAKFNDKGEVVEPTGINAKINARAKKVTIAKSQELLTKSMKQIASVAVIDGNTILMGKRLDTGRMTLPGGGMEPGEKPSEGAFRELWEEAGIRPKELRYLGSEQVKSHLGKDIIVHAFACFGKYNPTGENDPDKECNTWQKIDISNGLPEEVASNLHSTKNVVLKKLGLQSW